MGNEESKDPQKVLNLSHAKFKNCILIKEN
jgi:hypothetical protein